MNTDIKLAGWILINIRGDKLNHEMQWDSISEGWIWTEAQLNHIAYGKWDVRPTHKQPAYLSIKTGHTVTTGKPEAL